MERPYTICHILSALDGKITGAFMGTEAAGTVSGEYRILLPYLKNRRCFRPVNRLLSV